MKPRLVHLQRQGSKILQNCQVYIGSEVDQKEGWSFPRSFWSFEPDTDLKTYEARLRATPKIQSKIRALKGKTLGCLDHTGNDPECHGQVILKLWSEFQLGKFRTPTTHPDGCSAGGTTHPWPQLTHPTLVYPPTAYIYIDEAGLGALAGPVTVAGTVLLDPSALPPALHDSKVLKIHEREQSFDKLITKPGLDFEITAIAAAELDRLGGNRYAWRTAIRQTIAKLKQRHPHLQAAIVDGNKNVNQTAVPVIPMINADRLLSMVSAASILAKVNRDRYMVEQAPNYPQFCRVFANNKGYGSPAHCALIRAGHYTHLHRKTYRPLADLLTPVKQPSPKRRKLFNLQGEITLHK